MLVRRQARFLYDIIYIHYYLKIDDDEHHWIVRTCRKGWDEHVGGQNPRLKPDMSKLKN